MRTIAIEAVFQDGTTPTDGSEALLPYAQDLEFPQWTDGRLSITALGGNGSAYNITGGVFIFTARTRNQATTAVISHQSTIVSGSGGTAYIDIGSVDVGLDVQTLAWNLAFVDASGYIWGTTAQGSFAITASEYVPGQDVTVPESQQPLALGPNVGVVADYASLPLAADKPWLFYYVTTDVNNRNLYLSNGSQWLGVQRSNGAVVGTGTLGLYANPDLTGPYITIIGGGAIYFANASGNPVASVQASSLQMYGSLILPVVLTTVNYQVLATDDYVGVNSPSAARTVTLLDPNSDDFIDGLGVTIKDQGGNAASNNITINRNGAFIDGVAANVLINTNYGSRTLRLNGGRWWTVAVV